MVKEGQNERVKCARACTLVDVVLSPLINVHRQDVAATPAKQQLQAPEPGAAARGGADVTSAGGKQAKPGREQGAGSAGVVVKEHRRLRRPLGQVSTNSNSGKAAAGGAALTPLR